MALTIPSSDADAKIVAASAVAGFNQASVVVPSLSWRVGSDLAGRGSTMDIPVVTRATIGPYTPGTVSFAAIADTKVSCVMNQAEYWAVEMDITRLNAGAGDYLQLVATAAGEDSAFVIDQFALATAVAAEDDAFTTDLGTDLAPLDLSATGAIFDILVKLRTGIYHKGRQLKVYASPQFVGEAFKDTRVIAPGQAESHDGVIKTLLGIQIIETEANPDGKIVATSSPDALIGGTSLNLTDTTFRPDPFTRTASGLLVFGATVYKAESLAVVTVE